MNLAITRVLATTLLVFATGTVLLDAGNARATEPSARARELLRNWKGPGALVVVTHQVNMTALTGIIARSGEGVVLRVADKGKGVDARELDVVGRVLP